jgi:tetratricopeptide (TPR) repeat protein
LPIRLTSEFKEELNKVVVIPPNLLSKEGIEFLDGVATLLYEELVTSMESAIRVQASTKESREIVYKNNPKVKAIVSNSTPPDEDTRRFTHTSKKVEQLLSLFESNIQSLQFSEQSAYIVSLIFNNILLYPHKDVSKRLTEWIEHLFKEYTDSDIIKFVYVSVIHKGDPDPQSLMFEAIKNDPQLITHVLDKYAITFQRFLDRPVILKYLYDFPNRPFPDSSLELFHDKMVSYIMTYIVFVSLYFTKFTDYEISITEEKNLVKRINDALFLDKENVLAIILQAYMKINDNSIIAEKMIRGALAGDPSKSNPQLGILINIICYLGLALIYRKRMIYEIAEEHFSRALDLNPPKFLESILILNRGQNRLDDGNMSAALHDLLKAKEQSHTAAFAHTNLGKLYFKQGLNSKAETELLTAIEKNPDLAPAYFNLGVLYNEEGKKERAEKLFQTTLDLDGNFKEARIALKKIQETATKGLRDWIEWWFGFNSTIYRKALGYAIITFAGSLLVIMAIYDAKYEKFAVSQSLLIVLAVTIVTLLLPSISKLKLGPIELDMKSIGKFED